MKNLRTLLILFLFVVLTGVCHAQTANEFISKAYDETIKLLMQQAEMKASMGKLSAADKAAYINAYKQILNKQKLINAGRACFAKYSDSEIVENPLIFINCSEPVTESLGKQMSEIDNKYIYKLK